MTVLTLTSGQFHEPIGPFGHLNLDEGLIFISIVIAVAIIAYRKMSGKGIHLDSEGESNSEETIMIDTDVLIQPKQLLTSEYVDREKLPFSSIKRAHGILWMLLLFVLMAFSQGL
ncbi:MAG: hypothetical protein ACI8XB_001301 [Patiriisocius sp.]|jgi:hypothetical protein